MKLTHLILSLGLVSTSSLLCANNQNFHVKRYITGGDGEAVYDAFANAGVGSSNSFSLIKTRKVDEIQCTASLCKVKIRGKDEILLSKEESPRVSQILKKLMHSNATNNFAKNVECKKNVAAVPCTFDVEYTGVTENLMEDEEKGMLSLFKDLEVPSKGKGISNISRTATFQYTIIGAMHFVDVVMNGARKVRIQNDTAKEWIRSIFANHSVEWFAWDDVTNVGEIVINYTSKSGRWASWTMSFVKDLGPSETEL